MVTVSAGKKSSDDVWLKKGLTSVDAENVAAFHAAGFSAKTTEGKVYNLRTCKVGRKSTKATDDEAALFDLLSEDDYVTGERPAKKDDPQSPWACSMSSGGGGGGGGGGSG